MLLESVYNSDLLELQPDISKTNTEKINIGYLFMFDIFNKINQNEGNITRIL